MGIFFKRTLAFSCFLFILGAICGEFANFEIKIAAIAVLSVLFVIFFMFFTIGKRKEMISRLCLPILFALIGIIIFSYRSDCLNRDFNKYTGKDTVYQVDGIVLSSRYVSNYLSIYDIKVKNIDGNKIDAKIILEADSNLELPVGSRISASVRLSDFEDEGSFNEKRYYNSKGFLFLGSLESDDIIITAENANDVEVIFNRLNTELCSYFEKTLNKSSYGIINAVFLGNRSDLTNTVKRDFARTGTTHLLALSGLHLSLLTFMIQALLKKLRVNKSVRYVVLSAFIIFYFALTGFGLSVLRSSIMLMFVYLSYFLRRKNDSLTALMFAAVFILTAIPDSIKDIGFWMSVCATFGIIIVLPYEVLFRYKARKIFKGRIGKTVQGIISGLIISFAAILSTLPFSCFCFGAISLLGPIATIILSPLISVILFVSPLMLIFSFSAFLESIFAFLLDLAAGVINFAISRMSDAEHIYLSLDYSFVKYTVIPFFIIIAVLLIVKLRHKAVMAVAVLSFVMVFSVLEYRAINNDCSALYILKKQNEYICISDGGDNILIDISDGSKTSMNEAARQAVKKGYKEIDVMVFTHLHNKHINSFSYIASKEKVGKLLIPVPKTEKEINFAKQLQNPFL